jgi:GT2 family glycosyltransferase
MHLMLKNNPLVSIVVLCFNGLFDTTKPCLASIIKNTPIGDYELIIVDNASSDGTQDYLENFATQHTHVRIHLNKTNKGHSGGNNDGIRLAQGQYIVLLNNDTLVPAEWLGQLLKLFSELPDVGLVGPVTNSAGNVQCIELQQLNERNYDEISRMYVERQKGGWFTTEKLSFFCIAMRKSLVEKIGYLDEKFGIGMFEDDDYCIRAKKAGFTLAVVEDCFVYHKGSMSFKKLPTKDYVLLFNKNRDYFFEKHGILWTYTDIAFSIWSKIRSDFEAVEKGAGKSDIERIMKRVENMTNALFLLRDIERRFAPIASQALVEIQLAEQQRRLIEISELAANMKIELDEVSNQAIALKHDNERLTDVALASNTELKAILEKNPSIKHKMDETSRSRFYRIFRFFQRRGI